MINSTGVLEALRTLGEVQWARMAVGQDPLDALFRPPMISWRYVEPLDWVRKEIPLIVRKFKGNVAWMADLSAKNWVVMPERVHREFAEAEEGYVDVLADIKRSDQDFCVRATEDLCVLLGEIKELRER
jgi:hypothetical protein